MEFLLVLGLVSGIGILGFWALYAFVLSLLVVVGAFEGWQEAWELRPPLTMVFITTAFAGVSIFNFFQFGR